MLELRFDEDDLTPHAEGWTGVAERIEVLPDRLLLYVDDGEAGRRGRAPARRAPAVVAGAPQHAGGRVPAAHRPDAGGLMARRTIARPGAAPPPADGGPHPALRVLDYFLVLTRRTFRGTLFASFLSPLLYLVAMGYGLGSLVDAGGSTASTASRTCSSSRPGVLVATAMQTGVFDAS